MASEKRLKDWGEYEATKFMLNRKVEVEIFNYIKETHSFECRVRHPSGDFA